MARHSFHLEGGTEVEYFDSEGSPEQEKQWLDVIATSRQPSVLKTANGQFQCWIDGNVAGRDAGSIGLALGEIYRHLYPEETSVGFRPCPGIGWYVSDAAISDGVQRNTVCPACEEYTGVAGNLVGFHIL